MLRTWSMITLMLGSLLALPAVEADGSLAEPPLWPIGFKLPAELSEGWKHHDKMQGQAKAHVLAWMPPEVPVRAVMLVPNNTDSKNVVQHEPLRAAAARQGLALIYLRYLDGSVVERSDPPAQAEAVLTRILELVVEHGGDPGVRQAPWITFGKSSRGRFPFRTTWAFPERVIASVSYHAETPSWPMADWSGVGDENVLHLAVNGETEWEGTWYRHVRPSLLNYQLNTGWLTHQLVVPGVGHGNYADQHGSKGWGQPVPEGQVSCLRVWDYIAAFIDRAMTLRVPADADPRQGPVELLPVDRSAGILIHPRAIEERLDLRWFAFRKGEDRYQIIPWPEEQSPVYDPEPGDLSGVDLIRPAAEVPEAERAHWFWCPDAELAERWQAIVQR